ncbi:type II toxin-antitoxin system HicA family toxin [Lactococcus formosensis]|jgi:Predicted periplasmic or secreted lipoprotein|uniref:Type II toxin-antitoxin system HicA family toxin n=1 Tax=Lactococcus formosensis TaxID=1281486 RepID=A0A9X4NXX2_9LACT|nr:type II toxin-antitoxin system HicA family toxin [Lactococcus formosensis]MDG6126541.1 type II toxin-antitoxin system HicA family toxin [Lactococcus formosensis]MDG6131771.1 type II toxin-antitoxin system HicA family toxin [Lactococcus formosensis]MDG6133768.1 type II toxin-antitoxin system HicA family toxin [Lactococcus formosensis]MDG6140606.1 type II toxin-antitoxin system HicA family toxin [Lactococcus formosensis]MDG6142914.1 type II toxin-antitoxin system HicA family toxin [Lactococcu
MVQSGKSLLALLKKDGWIERRIVGSHHHLFKDGKRITILVHVNQDLGSSLERKILK